MKNRARKKNRTVTFDSLESRLVLSSSAMNMNTTNAIPLQASNYPGAYGVYSNILNGQYVNNVNTYGAASQHMTSGPQRNNAIVNDLGTFYQEYAATIPPLVQAVVAAENTVNQLNSSSSTSTSTSTTSTSTTSGSTTNSQALAAAQQAAQTAYNQLYQTMFNLVNSLGVQLYRDLGPGSAAQIRTVITGLPANYEGISYPISGPTSGSLLQTLNSLYFQDLANLQIVANLDIAEVYSLAYGNTQTFPNAPFSAFYSQYSTDLAQPVSAYNTAQQAGDTAGVQAAQLQIDNVTRTDVYTLANSLNTTLGPKYSQAVETLITGTPGPLTTGTNGNNNNNGNNGNNSSTVIAGAVPGAPAYGSLLSTLNSLPYGYRNDPTLLQSLVKLYAFI